MTRKLFCVLLSLLDSAPLHPEERDQLEVELIAIRMKAEEEEVRAAREPRAKRLA